MRNLPKNPPSDVDLRILYDLGKQDLTPQGLERKVISMVSEKNFWHPPPKGFLKFNTDGASKGNRSIAGCGGVLRDEKGSFLCIFHIHLGKATNNMGELMAMG